MEVTFDPRRRRVRGAALFWLVGVVAALAVGGFFLWQGRGEATAQQSAIAWAVSRENMRVSVVEAGQLKAAKSTDIYCEVKGGATILELIDEGLRAEKGDVLVRLDASGLEDELTAQQIKKLNAEAALIQAEKAKEIQESMNQSDIQKAEVDLAVAQKDLEKYLDGDYPLQKQQAVSDITLAEADLKNKELTAKDTKELVDLDFAAKTEQDRDELAAQQAKVKTEMAKLSSEMLDKYEKPRQELVLRSAVDQQTAELDRVKLRCEADLAQKVADWKSKQATFDLERNKLTDLEEQVEKTVIRAPSAGLVVYPMNQGGGGRGGSDRDRVEEGATAREHQLLLSLPDTREMVVVVNVHESSVDKVRVGMPAIVTIDALADVTFVGKVTFIAPLPDSQNQWLNPDLKVYRCEVALAGDTTMLRPGMSAAVEIVVDELRDTVAAPIHAVYRRGDRYYVYAQGQDGKPVVREVKIGLHNEQRVAVTEGLDAGDRIFLSVPIGAPQPDFPASEREAVGSSVDELRKQAESIPDRGTRSGANRIEDRDSGRREGQGRDGQDPGPVAGFDPSSFRDMSPEERKKAWDDMLEKMPAEERAKWEERAKQFREGGGDRSRGGGSGGGPGGTN